MFLSYTTQQPTFRKKEDRESEIYDDYHIFPTRLENLAAFVIGRKIKKPYTEWKLLMKQGQEGINLPYYLGRYVIKGCELFLQKRVDDPDYYSGISEFDHEYEYESVSENIDKVIEFFIEMFHHDETFINITSVLFHEDAKYIQQYFSRVYLQPHKEQKLKRIEISCKHLPYLWRHYCFEHILSIISNINSNLTSINLHDGYFKARHNIFSSLGPSFIAKNSLTHLNLSYVTFSGNNWNQLVSCLSYMSNLRSLILRSVVVHCRRIPSEKLCRFIPLPLGKFTDKPYKLEEFVYTAPFWGCFCHSYTVYHSVNEEENTHYSLFDLFLCSYSNLSRLDISGLSLNIDAVELIGTRLLQLNKFEVLILSVSSITGWNWYQDDIRKCLFGDEDNSIKVISNDTFEGIAYHMENNSNGLYMFYDEYELGDVIRSVDDPQCDMMMKNKTLFVIMRFIAIYYRFNVPIYLITKTLQVVHQIIQRTSHDLLPTYENMKAWLLRLVDGVSGVSHSQTEQLVTEILISLKTKKKERKQIRR